MEGKASAVQFVNCANACANLGYPAVMIYLAKGMRALNPLRWFIRFHVKAPSSGFSKFYVTGGALKVIELPISWPFDSGVSDKLSSAFLAKKIFLPKYIFPHTRLFYSRDWNFIKEAIEHKIPSIFEWDFPVRQNFEAATANSDFLKLVVANTAFIREDLVWHGIPSSKVIQVNNGVNKYFFIRRPEEAEMWRKRFLKDKGKALIVYAANLERFKGIDLLLESAKKLKDLVFVVAGGNNAKITNYSRIAKQEAIGNIVFAGYIPHSTLPGLFQAADVLVFPHLSGPASEFTSPLKFFEYLSSGTPIAISDISFLHEFKQRNLAICVSAPDHCEEFVKAILMAISKYPRRTEGYQENVNCAQEFTWESRMRYIFGKAGFSL